MTETPNEPGSHKPPAGFYPDQSGRNRWWDGNDWTQHYQSDSPSTTPAVATSEPPQKKKKRVFFWIFMAVQALFVIWIISAVSSSGGDATGCGSLSQQDCNDASAVGTGIGTFLIVIFWVFVDALLGIPYAIYRLAKRP